MPRPDVMVQCTFTRPAGPGTVSTVCWVERREDLVPGCHVTFKETQVEWTLESLGAEKSRADVRASDEARRTLADKLSTHA